MDSSWWSDDNCSSFNWAHNKFNNEIVLFAKGDIMKELFNNIDFEYLDNENSITIHSDCLTTLKSIKIEELSGVIS